MLLPDFTVWLQSRLIRVYSSVNHVCVHEKTTAVHKIILEEVKSREITSFSYLTSKLIDIIAGILSCIHPRQLLCIINISDDLLFAFRHLCWLWEWSCLLVLSIRCWRQCFWLISQWPTQQPQYDTTWPWPDNQPRSWIPAAESDVSVVYRILSPCDVRYSLRLWARVLIWRTPILIFPGFPRFRWDRKSVV